VLEPDDIQLLERLYGQSENVDFKAKIVGILGLSAQTDEIETNRYITGFMLREMTSQTPLVVIEIMDALTEIFADGDRVYDAPVFVQGQILTKIKQALPQLKKRVKSIDGRKEADLRERGDDLLQTFTEFISYKEQEAKSR
jgi:hypothetical protein